MEEKRVGITKIIIQLGEKEIILHTDEAKQLFEAMKDMFDKVIIHEHHNEWSNYPQRYIPVYPNTYPWYSTLGMAASGFLWAGAGGTLPFSNNMEKING